MKSYFLIGAAPMLIAALIVSACGDDSSSTSASDTPVSSNETAASSEVNVGDIESSSSLDSSNSESSSSELKILEDNKLAWEFMNPDIEYGEFIDERDGNIYRTVVIGEQTWMAQNLNYDNNNEKVEKNECHPGTDACAKYGRLYSVESLSEACPSGWHVPYIDEWNVLIALAGETYHAAPKLKTTSGWKEGTDEGGNGTDDFGFSAYPTGRERNYNKEELGKIANYWTKEIFIVEVDYRFDYFRVTKTTTYATCKHSIRCIKDSESSAEAEVADEPKKTEG